MPIDPADFVSSFARGLSVIKALATPTGPMSLGATAKATGMSRPAARRFLLTLVELGYARAVDGRFELTPLVMELGYSYLSGTRLNELVLPHLARLAAELDESLSVAVLDGQDIVYVARVPSRRVIRMQIDVGTRLPAHLTSMGRVLLADLAPDALEDYVAHADFTTGKLRDPRALHAELAAVGAAGYSIVEDELDYDFRGVSLPIRDRRGRGIAALNSSLHMRNEARATIDDVVLPALIHGTSVIQRELALLPDDAGSLPAAGGRPAR